MHIQRTRINTKVIRLAFIILSCFCCALSFGLAKYKSADHITEIKRLKPAEFVFLLFNFSEEYKEDFVHYFRNPPFPKSET